jgi:hypothetical protein
MRGLKPSILILFAFVLMAASSLDAATVMISPTLPSVVAGSSVQFAATVSGLTSGATSWSAGGVIGGSTTAGKITSAGLYTAPSTPPAQNPVQIIATASASGQTSATATTYAYILAKGPTITSIAPNSLPVGTITVTVTGTGFQSGATVFISYGNYSLIQLSTISVGPTSIVATGYEGPAGTASLCVKNPGSGYSNSIVVPVGKAQPTASSSPTKSPTPRPSVAPTRTTTPTPTPVASPSRSPERTRTATATPTATATAKPSASHSPEPTRTITPTPTLAATSTFAPTSAPTAAPTIVPSANPSASAVPFPVSGHPRLWITQNDLARLRSWATTANPIYEQGMLPVLNQAISIYNTQFFPGGVPNPNYPDPGDTQGYTGYLTEQYGVIFAFNSLIDPSPAARITYAQYARNLLMYAMNLAALGHLSGAPFRDPMFAVYNRANGQGEQWPLIVDWIYNATDANGNAILTSSDKLTIRNVFMEWANDCLNASTTGGDHPSPIGVTNSTQLLPGNLPYRMAANNYYIGHARLLTMMSLSIDPNDDPPVAGVALNQLGSTLRSYIADATGAWLYQQFAMFGDPATVANAYSIPGSGAGFGLASGGLPPEGMLYGESFGFMLGQLLALQTAGFSNVAYTGPQAQLIEAPIWDRYVPGILSSMTPTSQVFSEQPWLGPVFQYGSYGDLLRLWVTPDYMRSFALLALLDQESGKTSTHIAPARWFVVNAVQGGPGDLIERITSPWSFTESILYYLLLDPTAAAAADPRPTYPTYFLDPAAGRILAHSDWSSTNTMFDYRSSWESINHQDGDGGQFELYRNGEWLTKEMSNYDNNDLGQTSVYHNTLALQNHCSCPGGQPANLQWFETGEWADGSQWILAQNAGDPTTISGDGPGYVYATSNLTNLYNRPDFWSPPDAANDITQATRSILWLNNDYIVIYDRATSMTAGLFKRFNLSLVSNPVINGNLATETTPNGQHLFVQTLLPLNPSESAVYAVNNLDSIAQLEPTQYIFTVEDATHPIDVRFLNVLQGADASAPMSPATYLKSSAGVAFDGAGFSNVAVYFPQSATTPFTGTTLPAPAGVHTMYVTGLTPGAAYAVSVVSGVVTIATGSGSAADGAGVLTVSF